jgi:hypothetical protein
LNLSAALNLFEKKDEGEKDLRLPTPLARDKYRRGQSRKSRRNTTSLNFTVETIAGVMGDASRKALNPYFQEIMMGLPRGWTALRPMNKREFAYWQKNAAGWFKKNKLIIGDGGVVAIRRSKNGWALVARGLLGKKKHWARRRESIGVGIVPQTMLMAWELAGEAFTRNELEK